MKLTVKMLATGQVMELDDLPQDITVLDTKKRIERLEGSLASSQRLIFGGKTLKDDRTLQDCGIQKEALVHVVLRLKNSLTVSIRTMTGKTITLEVKPSDTVHGVKAMIEEIVQIPANKHTLNFAGQRLANHRALSDCGIMDKSTLRLILEPVSVSKESCSTASSDSSQLQEQDRIRVYGDLGTLYARCGGIFGIAAFVDRCMDKWMADATLNA